MRKLLRIWLTALTFVGASQAQAGIPVIDAANLAQAIQQVTAWAQQYQQMAQQYEQLMRQYQHLVRMHDNLRGDRGMAALVNNPMLRRYLPDEWNDVMRLLQNPQGYSELQQAIEAIRTAARILDITETGLDPNSHAGRAYLAGQNQVALNRALGEEGYKRASQRIASIQVLLDRISGAPDAKDVMDLQARIQAEQVMVQNESVKLAMLVQLQQAQREIEEQQAREMSIQFLRSPGGPRRF